jgi:hypothetical protein
MYRSSSIARWRVTPSAPTRLGGPIALFEKEAKDAIEGHVRNIAAYPLMAGPGAIATTIPLAGRGNGDPCISASCWRSSQPCLACASEC